MALQKFRVAKSGVRIGGKPAEIGSEIECDPTSNGQHKAWLHFGQIEAVKPAKPEKADPSTIGVPEKDLTIEEVLAAGYTQKAAEKIVAEENARRAEARNKAGN